MQRSSPGLIDCHCRRNEESGPLAGKLAAFAVLVMAASATGGCAPASGISPLADPDAQAWGDTSAAGDASPAGDASRNGGTGDDAGAPDDASNPSPSSDGSDGSAVDAGSYPPGQDHVRWAMTCSTAGRFGFGDGSLLVCDGAKWRYALRTDVPDGVYGAFTTRPDWFPPLRTQMNLPADACHLQLVQPPLDPASVTTIVPYGAMIYDHVTPIDHMYFGVSPLALDPVARQSAAYIPVRAPADGTIVEVGSLGSPTSIRVVIAHACETVSIFMVLNKLDGVLAPYQAAVSAGGSVKISLPIKAGDVFAMQRDNPMDFSLNDGAAWLSGFAHPFPYVSGDAWKPYTVDPLPYFSADVAAQYSAKMLRTALPRVGRIDWDKAGTAAGNWYLTGTIGYAGASIDLFKNATAPVQGGLAAGKNGYSWAHLSLSPHWVQPSVWIASMGTWADSAGDFRQLAILAGPPSPDALTVAMGTVVYELANWGMFGADGGAIDTLNPPIGYQVVPSGPALGILAVRVNADNTLTVEKRPDLAKAADFTGFSSRAETYWR